MKTRIQLTVRALFTLAAVGAASIAACGGQIDLVAGEASPDTACEAYQASFEAFVGRCWPGAVFSGVTTTQKRRERATCVASFDSPGNRETPSQRMAYAHALSNLSCDAKALPAACAPTRGALANGSACNEALPCEGGACVRRYASDCGVCGDVVADGSACDPEGVPRCN